MSAFSPTQWVIVAVIASVILYGLWHAIKSGVAIMEWIERRRARKGPSE